MNKIAIKAVAFCLSASMMAASMVPTPLKNSVNSTTSVSAAVKQILKNTTCETTDKWALYKAGGADATLKSTDGQLDVDIKDVGSLNYGVQLNYDIIPLYENGSYKLSFDISCTKERFVEAMIQMNGGDYTAYVWKGIDISPEKQRVEVEFVMEYPSDLCTKLCFNCGNQENDADKDLGEHHIYVDNVTLELLDDSKVDYSTFEVAEEPILINQVGYLPDAKKVAVLRGSEIGSTFDVVNAATDEVVYSGDVSASVENKSADETDSYADFSSVKTPGKYYIKTGSVKSFEFPIGENVYSAITDEAVYMFYTQRCGTKVENTVAAHPACHTEMATIYGTDKKIDVTGGWHDAGDYGRYVVPAAKSVADLLYAYSTAPSLFSDSTGIPESGNGTADILDEVRYELEWMLKMQDSASGGVYHKVSCYDFPSYCMPQDEVAELVVTPISTTATADFAASMAMAYEYYKDIDSTFADKCLAAAKSAWTYLEGHPKYELINPSDVTTGDYADFDKEDKDERYWAAAQLYSATGESKYEDAIKTIGVQTGLGWSNMGDYGTFAYLTMDSSKQNSDLKSEMEASIIKQANTAVSTAKANPYGETLKKYFWGCNMDVANSGMLLSLAEQIDSRAGYSSVAADQIDYLFGKNPLGTCFVTGFGTVSPTKPHHRPSMKSESAVPGMLVGGPDSALEDSMAKAFLDGVAPAKCYLDNAESYSTNEITIYWNSPLVALLADVVKAAGSSETITPDPVVTTTTEATTTTTATEVTTTTEAATTTTTESKDQPTSSSAVVDSALAGDVNCDGKVSATDVVMLMKGMVGSVELTANGKANADLNNDNKLSIIDLIKLKKMIFK